MLLQSLPLVAIIAENIFSIAHCVHDPIVHTRMHAHIHARAHCMHMHTCDYSYIALKWMHEAAYIAND